MTFTESNSHPICLIQISDNQLASGSSDSIIVWNLTTTAKEFSMNEHGEGFGGVVLSHTGLIISGSMDKTIKI